MIVGNEGGTNIGDSLRRAAIAVGWKVLFCDARLANGSWVWLRRISWHCFDHRPLRLRAFGRSLDITAEEENPRIMISTGLAPITKELLLTLKARGMKCIHYSTDDPWNPAQRASWFIRSLQAYDKVFSARRANLEDFRRAGCREVEFLPFAFDPELFFPDRCPHQSVDFDLIFVGGADNDRARVFTGIVASGLRVALYGDYWDRYESLRKYYRGRAEGALLRRVTGAAPVNICLCRRANRDGHVMRSFEIPACGGFAIAEDTEEHREIFGEEGECVLYFANGREAVEKTRWALQHPDERLRMSGAAYRRIVSGGHTYGDRLREMLA